MARFIATMGKRTRGLSAEETRELLQRVADLEARLLRVESRVRSPKVRQALGLPKLVKPQGRRCPGCTVPLPKGYRKPTCVWCGFVFAGLKLRDEVLARAARKPRARARRTA